MDHGTDILRGTDPDWQTLAQEAWFQDAQAVASDKRFFHWELEFPEIFFDTHGFKSKGERGFDAVIGNPPYVRAETADKIQRAYLMNSDHYQTVWGRFDIFLPFIELNLRLLREEANLGMIGRLESPKS